MYFYLYDTIMQENNPWSFWDAFGYSGHGSPGFGGYLNIAAMYEVKFI